MTSPCPTPGADGVIRFSQSTAAGEISVSSTIVGATSSCNWSQDDNGIHIQQASQGFVPSYTNPLQPTSVPMVAVQPQMYAPAPADYGFIAFLLLAVGAVVLFGIVAAILAGVREAAAAERRRSAALYYDATTAARRQMDDLSRDFLSSSADLLYGRNQRR